MSVQGRRGAALASRPTAQTQLLIVGADGNGNVDASDVSHERTMVLDSGDLVPGQKSASLDRRRS
jgi:hypothetical protein